MNGRGCQYLSHTETSTGVVFDVRDFDIATGMSWSLERLVEFLATWDVGARLPMMADGVDLGSVASTVMSFN